MIGATADAIDKAEDRSNVSISDESLSVLSVHVLKLRIATMEEAYAVLDMVGFPCIIRPSFTMGGTGGGIAYNKEEFEEICTSRSGPYLQLTSF